MKPNKMKKVMLIKPALYTDAVFDPIRTSNFLGLMYIASHLKEKGFEVKILDCVCEGVENKKIINKDISYEKFLQQKVNDLENLETKEFVAKYSPHSSYGLVSRTIVRTGLPDSEILKRISDFQPELIGIAINASCNHIAAIDLAKLIKKNFSKIKIVAGGQHVTEMAEQVLRDSDKAIDFAVKGDAQFVIEKLLEGKIPDSGICFLKNSEFIDKGEFRRLEWLDFPLIDKETLNEMKLPKQAIHTFSNNGRKYLDIMLSRGCIKKCEFCMAGSKNYFFDRIKLEKLEMQLKIISELGFQELIVQDDDLLRDKENFVKALDLIKDYGFVWQDNGGIAIEDLDEKTTNEIIKRENCTSLYFPFNPRSVTVNQAAVNTSKTYSKNISLLKKFRENSIYIFSSGIFGLDIQSGKDMNSEVKAYSDLIENGSIDQALIFAVSHLPGSKNFRLFYNDIVNPNDWLGYSIFVPHARTKFLSIKQVEECVINANKKLNTIQKQTRPWGSAFPKQD